MTLTLHSSQSISRTLVPSTYVSNVKDFFFFFWVHQRDIYQTSLTALTDSELYMPKEPKRIS